MKKWRALMLLGLLAANTAWAGEQHDSFYWLGQINKATAVINTDEHLLTPQQGQGFARSIEKVLQDGDKLGGPRPGLVITFEPLLIQAYGSEEITRLHAGRSSQDMLSTVNFAMSREEALKLAQALNDLQQTLLRLAAEQQNTIIPNYTNGVAAQPNSLGHYFLGYAYAFDRDAQRLQQYYARLNRSPMGATVLNGTGWPLDRDRMADYLGFDSIAYNTYDAGQIYSSENASDAAGVTNNIALHVGSFIEEIMQQYAQPRPWIILQEGGGNTYVSSAMPQKRNPGILNNARRDASDLLGQGTAALFRPHNIPVGMPDGRTGAETLLQDTTKLVRDFDHILNALVINPQRSLEELNLDWTCSQEIADVLMRKYNIPFRTGHHFASNIVTYARSNNIPPSDFTYEDAQKLYAELAQQDQSLPQQLPLSREEFRAALDPSAIVAARAVKGGPQPAEMAAMLRQCHKALDNNRSWTDQAAAKQQRAAAKLNSDFNKLLHNAQ